MLLFVFVFFCKQKNSLWRTEKRKEKGDEIKKIFHFFGETEKKILSTEASLVLFSPSLSPCARRALSRPRTESEGETEMEPEGAGGGDAAAPASALVADDADADAPNAGAEPPRSESLGTADTSSGSGTVVW